jgi:putative membrane protein
MPGLQGSWQRLHPLSPLVRAGRGLIPIVLILVIPTYGGQNTLADELGHLGLLVLIVALGIVSWFVTRWRLEAGVLRVDSGLVRRSSDRIPLSQIQAIDLVRPGLARIFGLSELRIRLAGGGRRAGRLAYLTSADADVLRARLLEMSQHPIQTAPRESEETLVTVPPGRLVASLLIARTGVLLELLIVALVAIAFAAPAAAGAVLSASVVLLVTLGVGLFRGFNAGYRLTVANAPDGLRLHSGLIETTAETIPRGRIQAIRMTEPLLWRILGWCRLDVDVASQKSQGRQDRAEARAVRALLPVGSREQGLALVGRVFADLPDRLNAPPRRVRWKSPLRFRHLSWGGNDRYAVTTSGRLRRVTDWVPLSKVQSIRLTEGPVQRALRLSSIHLDTAGRKVYAVLRDRDRAEASELLRVLPERCRLARARWEPGAVRRPLQLR